VTPTRAPIAAVVSIGDELLEGDVADGNASWLGRELALLGLRVTMMATLPDSRSSIARFVVGAGRVRHRRRNRRARGNTG
jgi:Predicted nucleotide-utilizing enzyme related to molybdopterin-biosynthesis enzyme MoeA